MLFFRFQEIYIYGKKKEKKRKGKEKTKVSSSVSIHGWNRNKKGSMDLALGKNPKNDLLSGFPNPGYVLAQIHGNRDWA